ncbi:MAG: DUF3822 family protein [Bacteroidia bacterium]
MVIGSKIKAHTELVDESFEQKAVEQLCLTAQITDSSFSFSVIDWTNSKQLLLKDYRLEEQAKEITFINLLEIIFEQNQLLKKPYKKISLGICNSLYTFVPTPLFDSKAAKKYLQLNCKLSENDEILYASMKNLSAYCIFALDKKIKSFFDYQFIGVKYFHQTQILSDVLLNNFKNKENRSVIINIRNNEFDTIIINNKQTELINTFQFTTADDLLFHLLYVFEQLSINPDKQEVLICGELLKNSSIYERLEKYIRHVKFINRNNSIEYSYKFNELPEHFYYSLLNQYQEF